MYFCIIGQNFYFIRHILKTLRNITGIKAFFKILKATNKIKFAAFKILKKDFIPFMLRFVFNMLRKN